MTDYRKILTLLFERRSYRDVTEVAGCSHRDVARVKQAIAVHGVESAAAVDGGDGPTEAELFSGADILGSDPLAVAERSIGRSQRVWATISDWQHPVTTVLGTMPAAEAISIITYSTLIHSWDVAVAVGRTVEFDDAEAALAEAVGAALVPALQPQGLFGPEVELGDDASPTQRVIAFAGRNPL